MMGQLVSNKIERMCKEMAVGSFKVLSRNLFGGTEKMDENP
jgi:hypothetical protein